MFGADPREVIQYLTEADAAVRNLIEVFEQERAGLEDRLRDATGQVETLRAELTAAQQCTAAYHADELLIGRTLVTAQKMAEELQRTAQTGAEEILAKAETIANDVVQTGCRNASDIMRKAQQESDDMLRDAKERATALLDLLRREAGQLAADAHETFERARRSVEQDITSATSRIDVCIAQGDLEACPPDPARDLPRGTPEEQTSPDGLGAKSQATGARSSAESDVEAAPANGSVALQRATLWALAAAVLGIVSQLRRFGLSFFG